jgi:hypothetical protein
MIHEPPNPYKKGGDGPNPHDSTSSNFRQFPGDGGTYLPSVGHISVDGGSPMPDPDRIPTDGPVNPLSSYPQLPPQEDFSVAGRQFLDAFYDGRKATTIEDRIASIKKYLLNDESVIVRGVSDTYDPSLELLALEYAALIEKGFNE